MKEIRGYNKSEMLYPDRCMLKWRGMLLSDHSERMKKETSNKDARQLQDKKKTPSDSHSESV